MKKLYLTLLLLSSSLCAMAQQPEQDNDTITTSIEEEALTAERAESTLVDAPVQSLTPNEARAGRGFTTDITFVPRGQWIFGGTASYTTHRNNDYRFVIIDNINSEGYSVNISPMIAYAPWKNMAVGIRFGYGRSMLALDSASLAFGEGDTGLNLDVDFYHQLKHSYTGTLFWRPYIPLGRSNRFAIFAEVQLNMTGSQSRLVSSDGEVDGYPAYRGSYSESLGGSIGLQPGIVAFATNNIALELSIGVFGIGYERTRQVRNQIDEGVITQSNMNFKVNFLSIGFGVSFYL